MFAGNLNAVKSAAGAGMAAGSVRASRTGMAAGAVGTGGASVTAGTGGAVGTGRSRTTTRTGRTGAVEAFAKPEGDALLLQDYPTVGAIINCRDDQDGLQETVVAIVEVE